VLFHLELLQQDNQGGCTVTMATYTPVPLRIAELEKSDTIKSLDTILNSLQKKQKHVRRKYILWPDLIEELETVFGCTRIEAAVEVRSMIDMGKIFQVPCHVCCDVCFSLNENVGKSSVYVNETDERQFKDETAKYVKQLNETSYHHHSQFRRRRDQKDRREKFLQK
jgi:hypothetical protein